MRECRRTRVRFPAAPQDICRSQRQVSTNAACGQDRGQDLKLRGFQGRRRRPLRVGSAHNRAISRDGQRADPISYAYRPVILRSPDLRVPALNQPELPPLRAVPKIMPGEPVFPKPELLPFVMLPVAVLKMPEMLWFVTPPIALLKKPEIPTPMLLKPELVRPLSVVKPMPSSRFPNSRSPCLCCPNSHCPRSCHRNSTSPC